MNKIGWCTKTVNPVIGCTFNCEYCYARKMNTRFGWVEDFSKPVFFPERLKQLYSKKPQIIFMDSMSDIADWLPEWVEQTFKAMSDNPQHKYLFLTKRCLEANRKGFTRIPKNIWVGKTVVNKDMAYGLCNGDPWDIDGIHRANQFLSCEPLLENIAREISYYLYANKWVIIGAETGNRKGKAIPQKEWIDSIVEQCRAENVSVFMKESLRQLMGTDFIQEFPEGLKGAK